VSDFIADHYGSEAVDYLAEPLLAGVYGGDPRVLSVRSVLTRFAELEAKYGSLTKGVLAERRRAGANATGVPLFRTLRDGLESLTDALHRAAGDKLEVVHSEALDYEAHGLRVDGGLIEAENIVLAAPAYECARLLRSRAPALAALLGDIAYSSSIVVALGYDRGQIRHPLNGFGFLVPKRERDVLVACTWVATKFAYRVPEDKAVLRCFLGGTDDRVLSLDDEQVVAGVRTELKRIMGVDAEPRFVRIARWPRAMAQYTVGHARRIEEIEALLREIPGLHLVGNAYYGIGVPDCVRMGKQAAERIAASASR
jgi:oxygen-dependent protoporphyrinogen oxidase